MKVLLLIWPFSDKFKEHVKILGPFHTEMNFIRMLANHKMQGFGYVEIIEEAQLVTKGCVKNVLSIKVFAKALFSLKDLNKALQCLLMEVFLKKKILKYILQHSHQFM